MSDTATKFAELAAQARDIQANPIRVQIIDDIRSCRVTVVESLDRDRVVAWILEAAKVISETCPTDSTIRHEWAEALIRVSMFKETDHFPRLASIFERAGAESPSASRGDSGGRAIKDDQLGDLIAQTLYEVRDDDGVDGYFDLIALAHGVDNRSQVWRVGQRLVDLDLIVHHTFSSGGMTGKLSARAVSIIERLKPEESLMDHLHERETKSGGIHVGGSVHNSALNADSPHAKQEVRVTAPKSLMDHISGLAKKVWAWIVGVS